MCFFNNFFLSDDKKYFLYDRFFMSNWNFTTEYEKNFKIPGFSKFFGELCLKFNFYLFIILN